MIGGGPDRQQTTVSEGARQSTLQSTATLAVALGALVAILAPSVGPSFDILGRLTIWPEVTGWTLFVFGVALWVALLFDWDWAVWRILILISGWAMFISVLFTVTWMVWWNGTQEAPPPAVYAVALYTYVSWVSLINVDASRKIEALKRQAG